MPYIGSSRYKYSPYLTIHFGKTEKFTPEGGTEPPTPPAPLSDSYYISTILLWDCNNNVIDRSSRQGTINNQMFDDIGPEGYARFEEVGKFKQYCLYCRGEPPESDGSGGMYVVTGGFYPPVFEANTEFTMEGWFQQDIPFLFSNSNCQTLFGFYFRVEQNGRSITLETKRKGTNYKLMAVWKNNYAIYEHTLTASITSIEILKWNHAALVRELSGTCTLYYNGKATGPKHVDPSAVIGGLDRLVIGGNRNSTTRTNLFRGWLEQIRFTKEVARYTSNFIPTGPFPTTG